MRHIFAALTILVVSLPPAAGQDSGYSTQKALSAAFWLDACKEKTTTTQWWQGNCVGQVQMLYLLAFAGDLAPEAKFCPPDGVTIAQTQAVVVKYLDDKPEQWHLPFLFLALDALRIAWPCP